MNITDKTKSIHHYSATWVGNKRTYIDKVIKRLKFILIRISSLF